MYRPSINYVRLLRMECIMFSLCVEMHTQAHRTRKNATSQEYIEFQKLCGQVANNIIDATRVEEGTLQTLP
jgi:hypothetical protein